MLNSFSQMNKKLSTPRVWIMLWLALAFTALASRPSATDSLVPRDSAVASHPDMGAPNPINGNAAKPDTAEPVKAKGEQTVSGKGSDRPVSIYKFTLDQGIMPAAWRLVDKAISEAETHGADYIIFRLNTYGGMVGVADSIRTKLLDASPVTVVFIDNNAASAGALISISCDSIYMSKGASIGAATVVDQTGQQLPDKYQSYMRSTMRATAEAQGRDPEIAEAMVDDRVHIPGVIDSGYTLTFTTTEAIKHGFCEGEAISIREVIEAHLGIDNYEITEYKEDWVEKVIAFLLNPMVNGLLLLLIMGGLWFELQSPGVGFPLVAAIIAAVLYFAPLYLEGLAEHWEVAIFLAGIGLLVIELFAIPGFGVVGLMGVMLIIAGLTLALVRNVAFDFSFTGGEEIALALARILIVMLIGVGLAVLFGKRFIGSGLFQRLVLQDTQQSGEGYTLKNPEVSGLVGKAGTAVTDLRPAGKVEIEDERYDATTEGEYIEQGEAVTVARTSGSYLIVMKK